MATEVESKSHLAYTAIRKQIVEGAYAPRQRLVVRTLAEELGMSTVPVREGLRRLEAEGWVTFRPNIGAEVRPVDATQWVALMDTLAVTEGHATAQAAPFLTPEDLERARTVNADMRAALERFDPLAASSCNQAFHAIFHERCPNEYLVEVVRVAADRISAMLRTVFVFVPTRTWSAVGEHEELLHLVEAKAAPDEIERYARDHKLRTVAAYLAREHETEDASRPPQELVREALADGRGAPFAPPQS
jgi:DNA-binding GntR family transcriptional regulator